MLKNKKTDLEEPLISGARGGLSLFFVKVWASVSFNSQARKELAEELQSVKQINTSAAGVSGRAEEAIAATDAYRRERKEGFKK